jgi:DNA-binding XRE family transcriptional regulator
MEWPSRASLMARAAQILGREDYMHKPTATLTHRLSIGLGETRRELGLSRESVARMAGVSRGTVANVEHGKASARSTVRVANALIAFNMFAVLPEPEPVARVPELPPLPDELSQLFERAA